MKPRARPAKRSRLNMRVPQPLLEWAKRYVGRRNTTVTQLFIDHVTQLKEEQEKVHG